MSDTSHGDESDDTVPLWRRPAVRWIALCVAGVIGFVFWRGTPPPKDEESTKPTQAFIGDVTPYKPAAPAAAAPTPQPAPAPQPIVATVPTPAAFPTMRMTPQGPVTAPAKPARPLMLSYAAPVAAQASQPGSGAAVGGGQPSAPQTRVVFKGGDIPGVKASAAIDDTYMLMPGLLPCVLDTAIDSSLPGPIACHLPGPVYSPKGVLLMEAETQVVGQYESIAHNGQNRLQAGSLFAHTPNGIWVPLADPMADDLGRNGLDGAINNHYLQRFGGAVLLSLTQSVLGIVQAEASKGGNTYLSLGQGGGVGGLAEQVLQAQINIAPTFTKHQGETIAIWLTSPIDFSDSYRVHVKGEAK